MVEITMNEVICDLNASARQAAVFSRKQTHAALLKLQAISEAIRAAERIPSGHLYAASMNSLSLQEYEKIIGILCRSGVVEKIGNELLWKGAKV